jgi:hypothetical protein
MSEASGDTDLERLVEKQARGESAGLPVEDSAAGAAELDTRRSKSPFMASGLLSQTVHVDVPGAEVDSPSFMRTRRVSTDCNPRPALATRLPPR